MPSTKSQNEMKSLRNSTKGLDRLTMLSAQMQGLTMLLDGEDNDNFDTMNDTLKRGVWSLLSSLAFEINELIPEVSGGFKS